MRCELTDQQLFYKMIMIEKRIRNIKLIISYQPFWSQSFCKTTVDQSVHVASLGQAYKSYLPIKNRGKFLTTLAVETSSPTTLPKLTPADKSLLNLPSANQPKVSGKYVETLWRGGVPPPPHSSFVGTLSAFPQISSAIQSRGKNKKRRGKTGKKHKCLNKWAGH